ncbi:hypothetical protein B9J80_09060 [Vibrio sp. V12_P9A6T4]|uniref:GNAT family N-acetyltransferase n=1 Tax=Vibrio sp. V12_P9A6T4 TaxID=1938667 RepID=UPI000B8E7A91|nr:GNAT family N-acetyltransferase [Vibrio sp. V12_P9A6T4]OXX53567.1 hypothetical protein B9J80_09060 [Vibrio sp. V12_P9A6T4]
MVDCKKYEPKEKHKWDSLIKSSRTPLFFFERNFLEYHQDRFIDHSLMFYSDEELIAVLPATINANESKLELVSHAGLTYGGLILSLRLRGNIVEDILVSLDKYCELNEISRITLKSIPYIFHKIASQEDLYFIHNKSNYSIIKRELSTVLHLDNRLKMSKGRKALVSRARKNNLKVLESKDFDGFHKLLTEVLNKHGAKPVHSVVELNYLNEFYPSNIILKTVEIDGEIVSGALLFVFESVIHTQYLATNELGRENGALDLIIEECISYYSSNKFKYFSFGVSTENSGRVLNQGLLSQKESFGGRSLVLDTYQVKYDG